jgi:hypothetical protein
MTFTSFLSAGRGGVRLTLMTTPSADHSSGTADHSSGTAPSRAATVCSGSIWYRTWGGALSEKMFSEEQLRSFPEITSDELIRYFTPMAADVAFTMAYTTMTTAVSLNT